MRKTIALIGGGFKPFTKGHYMLVSQAASEADEVYLFVSTGDRARPGQLPIFWASQMKKIWDTYLEKAMPSNTQVEYVKNPTSAMWTVLGNANDDSNDHNTYLIFGGDDDLPRYFTEKSQLKYIPRLVENDQIELRTFSREDNVNISGTELRNFIVKGELESFTHWLPEPVQRYGQEIFNILAQSISQISDKAPPKKKRKR